MLAAHPEHVAVELLVDVKVRNVSPRPQLGDGKKRQELACEEMEGE